MSAAASRAAPLWTWPEDIVDAWRIEERAVLAAVLLDRGAELSVLARVRKVLPSPACFYGPAHATVYESMLALDDRRAPIDIITLAAEIRAAERINAIGGVAFLGDLTDEIPTLAHVDAHAQLVAEAHRLRIGVEKAMQAVAYGRAGDMHALVATLAEAANLVAARPEVDTLKHISDMVIDQSEVIEAALAGGAVERVTGFPYPLPRLNEWTGGAHPGELIVIAARPGVGKTALALQMLVEGLQKRPEAGAGLMFSLEMRHPEAAVRAMALNARVDLDVCKGRAAVPQETLDALWRESRKLAQLPLYVDDASRQTPESIRARCLEIQRKHGLQVVVIDYLQLTETEAPAGRRRGPDNREQEIARATRFFKIMAKELGIPVILLAQLNRDGEKGGKPQKPRLSHLRESGAVEQDANVVIFLYEPAQNDGEKLERTLTKEILAILAKSRQSERGEVPTLFRGAWQLFQEAADDPETSPREARDAGGDFSEFEPGPRKKYGRAYDGAKGATAAPDEGDGWLGEEPEVAF